MVQQGKKVSRLKIRENRYYYIDLKNPLKPQLIRDSFYNRDEAKEIHNLYLKDSSRYFLIRGKDLIPFKGQYKVVKAKYPTKAFPYDKRKLVKFSVIEDKQIRKVNRRIRRKKALKERNIKVKYDYETPKGLTRREQKTYRERMRRHARRKHYKFIKPKLT